MSLSSSFINAVLFLSCIITYEFGVNREASNFMSLNTQVHLLLFRIEISLFDVFQFIDLNLVLVFLLSIEEFAA